MNVSEATLIVSLVIVFANGIGAIINNRRYVAARDAMKDAVTPILERLARIETQLEFLGAGTAKKGKRHA